VYIVYTWHGHKSQRPAALVGQCTLYNCYTLYVCCCFSTQIAAIEQEKEKNQFIAGIENFDAKKLKHTETNEKNVLPTKEVIEAEKQA